MATKLTTAGLVPPTAEMKLKQENTELHKQLNDALRSRVLDEDYEHFVTQALNAKVKIPKWTVMSRDIKKHTVMPVANFSDAHFDEVVRPEEVQNKNGYDRRIAERRLKFYFDNVCKIAHSYVKGFNYPGINVNMLGDNFSGFIHDELRRTNADTIMGSMLHWIGPMVAGLTQLADAFGRVWVTGVVGNHGRHDKKPVAKMRAQENFDWLFMHLIKNALEQKGDKRIEWLISSGQKLQFSIFDMRIITSHGDECKGGSGIAGMLSPQLIAFSRMKKTYEFDQWWFGHWHNLAAYRGMRCNGSIKSYDEYSALMNFDYQPPLQDFFLVAPQAGVIASWPVHCQLPDEPWIVKRGVKPAFSLT